VERSACCSPKPTRAPGSASPRWQLRPVRQRRIECESCWDGEKLVPRRGLAYFMVGMLNSAPSLMPDGQRWVTVLTFV
jgi:hypothetical protein